MFQEWLYKAEFLEEQFLNLHLSLSIASVDSIFSAYWAIRMVNKGCYLRWLAIRDQFLIWVLLSIEQGDPYFIRWTTSLDHFMMSIRKFGLFLMEKEKNSVNQEYPWISKFFCQSVPRGMLMAIFLTVHEKIDNISK